MRAPWIVPLPVAASRQRARDPISRTFMYIGRFATGHPFPDGRIRLAGLTDLVGRLYRPSARGVEVFDVVTRSSRGIILAAYGRLVIRGWQKALSFISHSQDCLIHIACTCNMKRVQTWIVLLPVGKDRRDFARRPRLCAGQNIAFAAIRPPHSRSITGAYRPHSCRSITVASASTHGHWRTIFVSW